MKKTDICKNCIYILGASNEDIEIGNVFAGCGLTGEMIFTEMKNCNKFKLKYDKDNNA